MNGKIVISGAALQSLLDKAAQAANTLEVMEATYGPSTLDARHGDLCGRSAMELRQAIASAGASTPAFAEAFLVRWSIDSDAATPEDAAREAWTAMRREDSSANVFEVVDRTGAITTVDLDELTSEEEPRPSRP